MQALENINVQSAVNTDINKVSCLSHEASRSEARSEAIHNANGTLPTISSPCKVNVGVEKAKTCSETEQRKVVDLREVKDDTFKAEELPAIAIAKNPGKTTARYALKSRHQKKSMLITRSSNKEGSKNLTKEFLVGGGKPVAKKRTSLRETNLKVNASQDRTSLFTKRKNAPPPKKIKQNRIKTPIKSEQLPSLCDTESMADCEKIDQMTLVDNNEVTLFAIFFCHLTLIQLYYI